MLGTLVKRLRGKTRLRSRLERLQRFLNEERNEPIGFTPENIELKHAFLQKPWGELHIPFDIMTFLNFLDRFADQPEVSFCELGVFSGRTAQRIVEYLRGLRVSRVEYLGIDNLALPGTERPVFDYDGMSFLQGDRRVLATQGKTFDFVFIDACHCAECVYRDSIVASRSIKPNGYLLLHDTALQAQYPWSRAARWHDNLQHYGERMPGARPLAVVEGITMARCRWDGEWELVTQDHDFLLAGGIRIYQKTQRAQS